MSGKAEELKFPCEWEFRLFVTGGAVDEVRHYLFPL